MEAQEIFMRRALELASHGAGNVSPNPLVGCVIVKDGKIVGEGWHRKYGESHAEVNAIASVNDKAMLRNAELYVTLEPCAHYGKTPPCADLILQYPFRKVFICNKDTFSKVNGRGIEMLREAGIAVETGVLEEEGRKLNRRFFTFVEKKRPYVVLKWAETSDGFIARSDYSSQWISGNQARRLVHKWRSEESTILVGTSTAFYDNPKLDVRNWIGPNPVKLVVDRNLKLEPSLNIFSGQEKVLVFTEKEMETEKEASIEYCQIDFNKDIPAQMLDILYKKNYQSVLVEGGAKLLQAFIDCRLWDEARIFKAPVAFKDGISAPYLRGREVAHTKVGEDALSLMVP